MQDETTVRMEKVKTAEISEAALNEMQDDLLVREALN